MSRPVKVTIIGGGLSAIYAFWGCLDHGYDPTEIQVLRNDRGMSAGAVFMYESPIPWPWTKVFSVLLGTCDQYSINQWGIITETSVNKRFENGEKETVTQFMVLPDDILVTLWGMVPNKADSNILLQEDFDRLRKNRDAVICCFADAMEKKDRQDRGFLTRFPIHSNKFTTDQCVVVYNGLSTVPWVRQTIMPGKIYTEYAQGTSDHSIMHYEHSRGNHGGLVNLVPDILPDCPSLSAEERTDGNLFRVGRMAAFKPGYLSHEARDEVKTFLEKL